MKNQRIMYRVDNKPFFLDISKANDYQFLQIFDLSI